MSGRINGGETTSTLQLLNMKNMRRLRVALCPSHADEEALRTFVLRMK